MASSSRIVPANKIPSDCCCDYYFEMRVPTIISYGPVFCGLTTSAIGKLFMFDEAFTGTIASSLAHTTSSGIAQGIGRNNGESTPWCASDNNEPPSVPLYSKIFTQSGRFTSTIRQSLNIFSFCLRSYGIEWDGTNTPHIGYATTSFPYTQKMRLFSGQFSSTIKTSKIASASHGSGGAGPGTGRAIGISYDSGHTPWAREPSSALGDLGKLFLQSGQFTTTLKTSILISSALHVPSGIGHDEPNTLTTSSSRLIRFSGQFTSTVKNIINNSSYMTKNTDISL